MDISRRHCDRAAEAWRRLQLRIRIVAPGKDGARRLGFDGEAKNRLQEQTQAGEQGFQTARERHGGAASIHHRAFSGFQLRYQRAHKTREILTTLVTGIRAGSMPEREWANKRIIESDRVE
jgi:hypothetical protein